VNVFRQGELYIFALTYGSQVQWVQNVLAAGECEIRTRGHSIRLIRPEVFIDPTRRFMPPVVRAILSLNRVNEFRRMHTAYARNLLKSKSIRITCPIGFSRR
jgi:hypothetical protein